jgi:hypothetical protein
MIENVNDDYCMTENVNVEYGHFMIGDVGEVQLIGFIRLRMLVKFMSIV